MLARLSQVKWRSLCVVIWVSTLSHHLRALSVYLVMYLKPYKRVLPSSPERNNEATTKSAPLPPILGLSQPPDFDYQQFIQLMLPSEKKLRIIFPDDHETRTTIMDLQTEEELLDMYKVWAFNMKWELQNDPKRHKFYKQLFNEIFIDFMSVKQENMGIKRDLHPLVLWELDWIDNEGTTRDIQDYMASGGDPFDDVNPGAEHARTEAKYAWLRSPGFQQLVSQRNKGEKAPGGVLANLSGFSAVHIRQTRRNHLIASDWKIRSANMRDASA